MHEEFQQIQYNPVILPETLSRQSRQETSMDTILNLIGRDADLFNSDIATHE